MVRSPTSSHGPPEGRKRGLDEAVEGAGRKWCTRHPGSWRRIGAESELGAHQQGKGRIGGRRKAEGETAAAATTCMLLGALTASMFLADPLRLHAITTRLGWEEETRLASTHTLTLDLYQEEAYRQYT